MKARIVARLGPGLVRVYLAEQERTAEGHSIGVMGDGDVVSARVAGLLELRPWVEVQGLLAELAAAGARVWAIGEPQGLTVAGSP